MPAETLDYTVASFKDIADWRFDDEEIWFGDHLIEPGKNISFLGPAGVGKSRILMQFAMHCICGVDWMGTTTANMYGKKWLFFQTENSRKRIKQDTEKIMSSIYCQAADQFERNKYRAAIEACLFVTYFKQETDGSMSMESTEDICRMRETLKRFKPDIVVLDPLNDKSIGDLNKDSDMKMTTTAICKTMRYENPNRVIFVVHHALTGKGGAAKAVSWESGSYGRNSKVLVAWARTQFNISPASGDNNEELLIACGKNSDGARFDTYGILYDKRSGVYVLNEEFDEEQFKTEVGIASKKSEIPEKVLELVPNEGILKENLVKRIENDHGISKPSAYRWIEKACQKKSVYEKMSNIFPLKKKE